LIARERGIPVFIVGSVGGRSSQLISEILPAERVAMNGQSEEINKSFAVDIDYSRLAQVVVGVVR
jgi:hypothetical protein